MIVIGTFHTIHSAPVVGSKTHALVNSSHGNAWWPKQETCLSVCKPCVVYGTHVVGTVVISSQAYLGGMPSGGGLLFAERRWMLQCFLIVSTQSHCELCCSVSDWAWGKWGSGWSTYEGWWEWKRILLKKETFQGGNSGQWKLCTVNKCVCGDTSHNSKHTDTSRTHALHSHTSHTHTHIHHTHLRPIRTTTKNKAFCSYQSRFVLNRIDSRLHCYSTVILGVSRYK